MMSPDLKMVFVIFADVVFWTFVSVFGIVIWIISEFCNARKMNSTVRFWPFVKHWHERGKAGYL